MKDIIKDNIIIFQDALIEIYETKERDSAEFNLFRDAYKSTIAELKEDLKIAENNENNKI